MQTLKNVRNSGFEPHLISVTTIELVPKSSYKPFPTDGNRT
jgi:hypothetical protein